MCRRLPTVRSLLTSCCIVVVDRSRPTNLMVDSVAARLAGSLPRTAIQARLVRRAANRGSVRPGLR